MLALRKAIWDMTPEALQDAQQTCQERMESFPRDVQNLVAYAELFWISFLVAPGKFDNSPDKRNHLVTKLMRLAPGNAHTHLYQAFVNLMDGQLDACDDSLERALDINPLDSHLQAIAGLIYLGKNNWSEGIALIEASIDSLTTYPDWYHMPLALDYYRQGEYQQALTEAEKISTPTFWANALRAALYRQQGLEQRATQELDQLKAIYPDIATSKPAYFEHLQPEARTIIETLWAELMPENV